VFATLTRFGSLLWFLAHVLICAPQNEKGLANLAKPVTFYLF